MSALVGFRNAVVLGALIALMHGLLLRHELGFDILPVSSVRYAAPAPMMSNNMPLDGAPPADGLKEMFEFASNGESWEACDRMPVDDFIPHDVMRQTPCQAQEQVYSQHAVVNTYAGEKVINGGENGEGLTGYDSFAGHAAAV
jgi:hypothetical protein